MSHFWVICFFSDKANVANTGNVNWHNIHYWANKNPRWMRTVPLQHPCSVNCWCGIVDDQVIVLYFFKGHLTGPVYAKFLQNVLPQLMVDVCLHVRMNMWLQRSGAPPPYAHFWRKVDRTRRPCSLATSFAKSNIIRLLFLGFCQRTRYGGSNYHAWRHERKNTPSMYRNYTKNVGWS